MPPQMGSNHGACDVMPPTQARTSRRAALSVSTAEAAADDKATSKPEAETGATVRPKRLSRPRKAATGRRLPSSSPLAPASRSLEEEHGGDQAGDDDAAEMRSRLTTMQDRFGAQLHFLVTEFTKLEAQLSLEWTGSTTAAVGDENSPQQQLGRLRFFIEHVKRTTDRMDQARRGLHHYTSEQLDMLEEHITHRLLPVKKRMLAQLAQQQQSSPSTAAAAAPSTETIGTGAGGNTPPPPSGNLFLGGIGGGKDGATAVSDGWVVGSPSPPLPSSSSNESGGGGGGRVNISTCDSDRQLSATTSSASLPRACSSLSFADLGDLCGDQEGGGVFLVGGEDCDDDVHGSGIGLDLYDLGQGGKDPFLPEGQQRAGRWSSISTRSSYSTASTDEEELSDDSLSIDADCSGSSGTPCSPSALGSGESSLLAAAAAATRATKAVITEARPDGSACVEAGAVPEGVAAGGASASKSGIDQEMRELSELFAPDAFLMSTVLDTEMEAGGGGGGGGAAQAGASGIEVSIEPTATEPNKAPQQGAAAPGPSPTTAEGASAVAVTAPAAVVKMEFLPAAEASAPSPASPPAPALAPAPAAAAAAAAATAASVSPAPAPAAVAPKQECRCGQAACPSLITAARKRPMAELSPSLSGADGPAPLSMVTGLPFHQSSRQRKRQRSLAPVLSAPRTVSYECSLCKESYSSEIASNPWWSLFLHECPRCHRMQIPRVDAASAAVSVDYIHAVCAEEGEGCDSDGYGSDSCSDSDDDVTDDDREREGIAAFDTDIIAGDSQAGCKEGRLSTFQASRLLVLMSHARTCPGRHANPKHAEVCQSTKFLMLHMRDCTGHTASGDPCEHRWCRPCKSLLSHLIRCPDPNTCRICTPLDLPGPLRQLRDLNVAQARHASAAAAAAAATTTSPSFAAVAAPGVGGVPSSLSAAPAAAASARVPSMPAPATAADARCAATVKSEDMCRPSEAATATGLAVSATTTTTTSLRQQLQQQVVGGAGGVVTTR
ncbi:unnamed protein product [Ectocarpus sp. CCAP 1310/34]|nr:unnamed protein product [Ectocarpus sp. CCAP 1310/34]